MVNKLRNKLRQLWARWRLRRICKALGIKPYPEAEAYVLHKNREIFRGGRCNGKTMALILDELVYKRVPPSLATCDLRCRFCQDRDYNENRERARFYTYELFRAVRECEAAGIDVGRGWLDKEART